MSANDRATPSVDVPRKPRRRWLQISLRTLLVLVTLLSIGLGWFVHRGERQRRAVALKAVGGVIFYDSPDFPLYERSPDWARWIPRDYFENAYAVDMSESEVTMRA